jgi:hypothetical protein
MRSYWTILLIMAVACSFAAARTSDKLKTQFESALKVLGGQLSLAAKAKIAGVSQSLNPC